MGYALFIFNVSEAMLNWKRTKCGGEVWGRCAKVKFEKFVIRKQEKIMIRKKKNFEADW